MNRKILREVRKKKQIFQAGRKAWNRYADQLSQWAMERMVVRSDAYLGYYRKANGDRDAAKRDGLVTPAVLRSHFTALDVGNLIGLYTTNLENECRWLAIDLDRHKEHSDEVAKRNTEFVKQIFDALTGLGFHPLLIDTNGRGGFHIFMFFDQPLPAKLVRSFGRWLVKDWEASQLASEPEVFPKQDSIKGEYGNGVRLPGLHHTFRHYSRVWDGKVWASGEKAIELILAAMGDSINLIPDEAKDYQPPKSNELPDEWWKQYGGDLRTLDVVGLFQSKDLQIREVSERQYEVTCPWADQHSTGGNTAQILLPDEVKGGFPTFHCFHAHCSTRSLKEVLALFGKEAVDQHCRRRFGQAENDAQPVISANDPLNAAREFQRRCFAHPDGGTLFHLESRWVQWDGRTYQEVTDDDIRAAALALARYLPVPDQGRQTDQVPAHQEQCRRGIRCAEGRGQFARRGGYSVLDWRRRFSYAGKSCCLCQWSSRPGANHGRRRTEAVAAYPTLVLGKLLATSF